jgi:hypothetical protein
MCFIFIFKFRKVEIFVLAKVAPVAQSPPTAGAAPPSV